MTYFPNTSTNTPSGESPAVDDSSNLLATTSWTQGEITDAIDTIVFGDEYDLQKSDAQASDTTGTYQTKASFVTAALPAGTYRVSCYYRHSSSNANNDMQVRLRLDGTTNIFERLYATGSSNISVENQKTHINEVVLTAGAHTFNLDFRKNSGAGTVYVQEATFEILRVA